MTHRTSSSPRAARLATAAALLVAAGSSQALEYTGYFRGGPGLTTTNASRACYALPGGSAGLKYRLGNECDFYGEFQLSQGFQKDGIDFRTTLMVNSFTPATEPADPGKRLAIEQLWGEARGFDFAPEATVFIGKERGRRGDVHIVDTFFTEMAGVGAGIKGLAIGPGKLGTAFYRTDTNALQPGSRFNVEYVDLPVNPGGKLNFFGTLTDGSGVGGTSGAGLTLRHDQANLFGTGLDNVIWLQYAQGSAGLNSNFGDLTAGSQAKSWRVVQSLNGQVGNIGGQSLLLFAQEKDANGRKTDSMTVGGRVALGVTKNFKFVTDVGFSQVKPDGGQTARLTKVTLAPTLSIDNKFWTRPEFRVYVTSARWSGVTGDVVTGQQAYAGKTSGTSYGAQIEWWF